MSSCCCLVAGPIGILFGLFGAKKRLEAEPSLDSYTSSIGAADVKPYRITFINGILNDYEDCIESAQIVSECHKGAKVHFVADLTRGVAADLGQSCLFDTIGVDTEAARRLAALWRKLFTEMGAEESIIHYGDSRGCLVTRQALALLKPEERPRLDIHLFGSPSLIYPEEGGKVEHHRSDADGIPYCSISSCCIYPPRMTARALCGKEKPSDRVYPTLETGKTYYLDHGIRSTTYRDILRSLGEKYTSQSSPVTVTTDTPISPSIIPSTSSSPTTTAATPTAPAETDSPLRPSIAPSSSSASTSTASTPTAPAKTDAPLLPSIAPSSSSPSTSTASTSTAPAKTDAPVRPSITPSSSSASTSTASTSTAPAKTDAPVRPSITPSSSSASTSTASTSTAPAKTDAPVRPSATPSSSSTPITTASTSTAPAKTDAPLLPFSSNHFIWF